MPGKSAVRARSNRTNVVTAKKAIALLKEHLAAPNPYGRTFSALVDKRIEGNLELSPQTLAVTPICSLDFRRTCFLGNLTICETGIVGSGLSLVGARVEGKLTIREVHFRSGLAIPGAQVIPPSIRVNAADLGSCEISDVTGPQEITLEGSYIRDFLRLTGVNALHKINLRLLTCSFLEADRLRAEWLLMNGLRLHQGQGGTMMLLNSEIQKLACDGPQAAALFYLTGGRIPLVFRPNW